MQARLMRIDAEDDARTLARLCGRVAEDPNVRGFAAVWSPLGERQTHLVRESLARLRLFVVDGPRGWALVGDPFTLFTAGRELVERTDPEVAALGGWLRDAAAAVDGAPEPLAVGSARFDWARPLVMGVVNVTPDSFSDGGRYLDPAAAVAHGLALVAAGADLLDVGGESTRPRGAAYGEGALTVPTDEEIARVAPVIRALRERTTVPVSVDTRKAAVAAAALEAGAAMVNDVSGLRHDAALATVVARAGVPLCLMHTPVDIEGLSHERPSDDILGEVLGGLCRAMDRAAEAGVARTRLLVDPGIGFGKSAAHNLYLLRHLEAVVALGRPVLVGASRKASLARAAAGDGPGALPMEERLPASLAAAVTAVLRGAHVVRVHDVRETVQALRVVTAIRTAGDAGRAL